MTNQSIGAGKRIFKTAAATVIAVIIVMSIFASIVFAQDSNPVNVKIIKDNDLVTVTSTTETEPIDILSSAGIKTDPTDKLDLSAYVQGEGGTIVIKKRKTVNVDYYGKVKSYKVYSATVGSALKEAGITLKNKDKTNYESSDAVKDGMVIKVSSAIKVKIRADKKKKTVYIVEGTVADALREAGITLGKYDYTKPSLNSKIKSKKTVKVFRVKYKRKTVNKKINYSTKSVKDNTLTVGKTKVVKEGVEGKKRVTYKIKYLNGKKVKKKVVKQKVIKKAEAKVVKVGTKQPVVSENYEPNGVESKGGYKIGQVINGRYTHYCACATCNGNSNGITSSGRRISNGMANPHYIACNWLPLGSVINVDGTNYTVVDRGGSGLSATGRIDIFTPEGHAACYRYGTGSCTIKIVRLGW
jgi:uncharacterized protein YabE (DUF348 family)